MKLTPSASSLRPSSLMAQPAVKRIPADGIAVPAADRAELESGLAHLQASIAQPQARPAAARRPDLFRGRPLLAPVQRILQARRDRRRQSPAPAGRRARRPTRRRTGALDHRHRTRGARLHLQNRQEHPAVRPGRAALVLAHRAAPLAPRHLVPRPRRSPHPGQLPHRATEIRRRVHAARHHRAAPLRTLLQRQQVRRRSGPLRSARRRQAQLPDRREPHSRPRLQHGRRVGLAPGRPLPRPVGRRIARRGLRRVRAVSQDQDHRRRRSALVGAEALALLRRCGLRRQSLQPAHHRIPRRDRSATAGRRHDGARHGRGRPAPGPRGRSADRAQVPPRFQNPGGTDAG